MKTLLLVVASGLALAGCVVAPLERAPGVHAVPPSVVVEGHYYPRRHHRHHRQRHRHWR